ncbi:hypothetical protein CONLIGDRAFT_189879 [Coniochaeta ligniaria NRRL 30616]|uniref:Uncharacterized protein n=1 Tax=Coniochaeta ligniaria NRRL 30616 TaxID=1408157 RepID=A0A1J7JK25_9PEZI|nr:hypothetical protein CONLIGDRAFT_189879 [Coniochaeta ligniaria NRRL 30616]
MVFTRSLLYGTKAMSSRPRHRGPRRHTGDVELNRVYIRPTISNTLLISFSASSTSDSTNHHSILNRSRPLLLPRTAYLHHNLLQHDFERHPLHRLPRPGARGGDLSPLPTVARIHPQRPGRRATRRAQTVLHFRLVPAVQAYQRLSARRRRPLLRFLQPASAREHGSNL